MPWVADGAWANLSKMVDDLSGENTRLRAVMEAARLVVYGDSDYDTEDHHQMWIDNLEERLDAL